MEIASKPSGFDPFLLPLYGCLTGVELPSNRVMLIPGIALCRVYVDTIGATVMAFAPPPDPGSPHPAPWAAVRGGFTFESRVEIEITDVSTFDGLSPSVVAWLVASVLRLRMPTPIRLAILANMSFHEMGARSAEVDAVAFESAPHQIGAFEDNRAKATDEQIAWLRDMLPVAARLYHQERFFRAYSLYDRAQWSPTGEMGTVLIWTAIEILFDLSGEREKTKAVCNALAKYVGVNESDRDRAYQVIKDLYFKRGRTVHAGRRMDPTDAAQSFRLASVAFQRVLIDGKLPLAPERTIH